MTYSPNKSLLSKVQVVWKTLVVLVLSVLLFAPTPALAFDYSGTLQSYVSSAKVEIDGVLTSIKKLPSLSYENGKITLADIDTKLQKIQTNAGNNAKNFQNLSAQAQTDYKQVLNQLKEAEFVMPFLPDDEYVREFFKYKNDLESEKQRLVNGIVLTNKISQLCDDLEKRVNLAKQKSGNVKEYADALNSFSEPDILTEIAELNTFVANLTKNLTLAT